MNIEKYVFALYKDRAIIKKHFTGDLEKRFKIDIDRSMVIYQQIVKYQITRYGTQLYGGQYKDPVQVTRSKESARQRKRRRRA